MHRLEACATTKARLTGCIARVIAWCLVIIGSRLCSCSRQIVQLAGLCTLGLAALSGCSTPARYVTVNSTGGVVAIPSNTNEWPNHYRKQAEELMQAKCADGYVIEYEEEFVIGTHRTTSTSSTGYPAQAAPPGMPMTQNAREATSLSNQTEWRIYFRRTDAQPGSAVALKVQPQIEVAPLFPVQRAVMLTPTGTPVQSLPTPLIVAPNLMQGPVNSGRPPGTPDW